MKVTIEVSPQFIATRDGASVEFDPTKIASDSLAEMIQNCFEYGIGQKVRDARSGATKAAESDGKEDSGPYSQTMMESALASIYSGEWTQRTAGLGVDDFTRHARVVIRQLMKAKSDDKQWAAFTGLSDADQLAKIDANVEANRDAITPAVESRIAEAKAKADAKRKLGKTVELSI